MPSRSVTDISLPFYTQMMFVPHSKHNYRSARIATGIAFTSILPVIGPQRS
jgi:hypothetical protein